MSEIIILTKKGTTLTFDVVEDTTEIYEMLQDSRAYYILLTDQNGQKRIVNVRFICSVVDK